MSLPVTDSRPAGRLRKHPGNGPPIRLGISSCLLGHEVRYDGGHKWNRFLVEVLGAQVEWVPVCPEVEIGLGIPRPPIQLENRVSGLSLIMPSTGEDLTQRMKSVAGEMVKELRAQGIVAFVFKSRSPSCGIEKVKVLERDGSFTESGVGAFTTVLLEQWPELPIIDEIGVSIPEIRKQFLNRLPLKVNPVLWDHPPHEERNGTDGRRTR